MLKFPQDKHEGAVEVSFTLDEDGDLRIQYDGIDVAYIARKSGRVCSLTLTDSDIASLRAKGVRVDGDFLELV